MIGTAYRYLRSRAGSSRGICWRGGIRGDSLRRPIEPVPPLAIRTGCSTG